MIIIPTATIAVRRLNPGVSAVCVGDDVVVVVGVTTGVGVGVKVAVDVDAGVGVAASYLE
jgi:hypothetical protein